MSLSRYARGRRAYKSFAGFFAAFLVAYVAASLFAPVQNSDAYEQEVKASVDNANPNISVTPGLETIELEVGQPTAAGTLVKAADTLVAKANSETGYQLYVSVDNNHSGGNRLYLDGDSTNAFISPNHDSNDKDIAYGSEAALADNSWGFTTSATNYGNNVYSAVPLLGNEAQIGRKDSATSDEGDQIPIYYAVNVNTNMASGTYSGKILYTIVADDAESDVGKPSINPQSGSYNDSVTIVLPLQTRVSSVSDLGTIEAKIGDSSCLNQSYSVSGATLTITCNVPALSTGTTYNVSVTVQKYGRTYTRENEFTYGAPTLANITTMQEMTTDICVASSYQQTATLKDARGGGSQGLSSQSYGVIKAIGNAGDANSECWMTDNLNLYNATISAETSDFTSPTSYTIPNGIANTTDWNTNNYTTKKVEVAHGLGQYANKDGNYTGQVYYNWTTAVALEDGSTTAQQDRSICPKNWKLPANGDAGVSKTWAHLMAQYGITSNGGQLVNAAEGTDAYKLGFRLFYGLWLWHNASESNQGSYGYFWSSTPSATENAYYLSYWGSGINPQNNNYKGHGFSIRCVAR